LDGLADALLVIRGRDDLQIFTYAETGLLALSIRRLHHEVKVIDAPFKAAPNDDLVLPPLPVLGKRGTNRFIAPAIAADRLESRRDVLNFVPDTQMLGEFAATGRTEPGGVALRQQQTENPFRPQRLDRQRRTHGTVDA